MPLSFPNITLDENEVEMTAIRASGPGGQNVNKVSSAIHLRFDIRASSLPDPVKKRLLSMKDRRLSLDGVLVIKAQHGRSQDKNREDAMRRLRQIIADAAVVPLDRKATRPTFSSRRKRLETKAIHSRLKHTRGKIPE
ncbi:MAG: alternative ribosome rescue aminoacyl-tRNA hydrolase ArfB [Burkholderiaceae bacterium]